MHVPISENPTKAVMKSLEVNNTYNYYRIIYDN